MITFPVRNVEEALPQGIHYLQQFGVEEDSRAGRVLVAPYPVTTIYSHPWERVLFNLGRDANPFFHLMESLWMLAGRNDARWLDQFVGDFSARFAEPDGRLHGAYGFRWRDYFDMEGGSERPDQLATIVKLLRNNPQDRQAVLTMWDPVADLGVPGLKDRPCNTHCYLRVRTGPARYHEVGIRKDPAERNPDGSDYHLMNVLDEKPVLDLTVLCRSNDIIWGAYGANAVHFSVLQEYLAGRIGVGIGRYYQVSNNYHAYTEVLQGFLKKGILDVQQTTFVRYGVAEATPIVTVPEAFDEDLNVFMATPHAPYRFANQFFPQVAIPLYRVNNLWKQRNFNRAMEELEQMPQLGLSPRADWYLAARAWAERRLKK